MAYACSNCQLPGAPGPTRAASLFAGVVSEPGSPGKLPIAAELEVIMDKDLSPIAAKAQKQQMSRDQNRRRSIICLLINSTSKRRHYSDTMCTRNSCFMQYLCLGTESVLNYNYYGG